MDESKWCWLRMTVTQTRPKTRFAHVKNGGQKVFFDHHLKKGGGSWLRVSTVYTPHFRRTQNDDPRSWKFFYISNMLLDVETMAAGI